MNINIYRLDRFTDAYIECALWSSYDESVDPLDDNYGIEDISEETLKQMVADCQAFQEDNQELLSQYDRGDDYAGHDFWLTRNRHGAGFWDRGLPGDLGEKLTSAAHTYGSVDLYVGDDGKIYA
jgi:hypothetical protein